jgi:hypothetical protein
MNPININSEYGRIFNFCWKNSNTTPHYYEEFRDQLRFIKWGEVGLVSTWMKSFPMTLQCLDRITRELREKIVATPGLHIKIFY